MRSAENDFNIGTFFTDHFHGFFYRKQIRGKNSKADNVNIKIANITFKFFIIQPEVDTVQNIDLMVFSFQGSGQIAQSQIGRG